jgi:hypothetical protein
MMQTPRSTPTLRHSVHSLQRATAGPELQITGKKMEVQWMHSNRLLWGWTALTLPLASCGAVKLTFLSHVNPNSYVGHSLRPRCTFMPIKRNLLGLLAVSVRFSPLMKLRTMLLRPLIDGPQFSSKIWPRFTLPKLTLCQHLLQKWISSVVNQS